MFRVIDNPKYAGIGDRRKLGLAPLLMRRLHFMQPFDAEFLRLIVNDFMAGRTQQDEVVLGVQFGRP